MGRALRDADVRILENFFAERGERPLASICPHAHSSALARFAARAWTPAAFENVLVRQIDPADRFEPAPERVEVRIARTEDEIELWAALVANAFSAPEDPLPTEMRLARASADVEWAVPLIGYVDGKPAGSGELTIDGDIAWLSTDATLPHFRRAGVQGALQRARLELARDAGCTLAMTEAMPGSGSQRNMERLGFTVVYTRVEILGPPAPAGR